jgi:hypothetical protein
MACGGVLYCHGGGFASITANPIVKMAAICIASWGLWFIPPVFYTLPTAFLSGAGAAAGIAAINSIGTLGGYLGPKSLGNCAIGVEPTSPA